MISKTLISLLSSDQLVQFLQLFFVQIQGHVKLSPFVLHNHVRIGAGIKFNAFQVVEQFDHFDKVSHLKFDLVLLKCVAQAVNCDFAARLAEKLENVVDFLLLVEDVAHVFRFLVLWFASGGVGLRTNLVFALGATVGSADGDRTGIIFDQILGVSFVRIFLFDHFKQSFAVRSTSSIVIREQAAVS